MSWAYQFFFPCILLWPQQPLLYLHISVILNQNLMTASTESLAKVDFTGEEEALSFSSNWQVRILRTSFRVNWKVLTNQAST